jgi:hypothetical protein
MLTVTDTLPTGLNFVPVSGGDWSCSGASPPTVICTSSTAIAANGGTSAITLTVSVASNAGTPLTNTATASGGGAANTPTASDPTDIWIALSGTLFKDNGKGAGTPRDGIQEGAEPNFAVASSGLTQSYVVILDATGKVLAVADICPLAAIVTCPSGQLPGDWSTPVPYGTGYIAYVTRTPPSVGQTIAPPSTGTAPTGWMFTGQNSTVGGTPSVQGSQTGKLIGINPSTGMTLNFGVLSSSCPAPPTP